MGKQRSRRVVIDRMAHGGQAIGRFCDDDSDTRLVFVRDAVIGDVAEVSIIRDKKRFATAQLEQLIEPGSHRVDSRCPAATHGSGCCDFSHIDPKVEAEIKRSIVVDQLRRIAHCDAPEDAETIDMGMSTGWRTRMRLGVDRSGRAGLRRRSSHELVTDHTCSAAVPGLLDGIVGSSAQAFPGAKEVLVCIDSQGERHVVVDDEVLEGSGLAHEVVAGRAFVLPSTAFWQAHCRAPELYHDLVSSWLIDASGSVAWDLYGGVGLFVEAVRGSASRQVYSVELAEHAAECGRASFDGVDGVHFVPGDCATVVADATRLPDPDVVVLDPPRIGADKTVIEQTARRKPSHVVHIGCDPATFARDAAQWVGHGYSLRKLAVVDAFPASHHCETIGLFVDE